MTSTPRPNRPERCGSPVSPPRYAGRCCPWSPSSRRTGRRSVCSSASTNRPRRSRCWTRTASMSRSPTTTTWRRRRWPRASSPLHCGLAVESRRAGRRRWGARRQSGGLHTVPGSSLIVNSRDTADEEVNRIIASMAGFTPDVAHRVDSLELVQDLIVAGLGVGLLPGDAPTIPGVRLLRLRDPDVRMRAYAVTGVAAPTGRRSPWSSACSRPRGGTEIGRGERGRHERGARTSPVS